MERNFTRKLDEFSKNCTLVKIEWLDVPALAKRLKTTKKKLLAMVSNDKLPPHSLVGGSPRWRLPEIESWERAGMPDKDTFRDRVEESIKLNVIGNTKPPKGLAKEWEDRLN